MQRSSKKSSVNDTRKMRVRTPMIQVCPSVSSVIVAKAGNPFAPLGACKGIPFQTAPRLKGFDAAEWKPLSNSPFCRPGRDSILVDGESPALKRSAIFGGRRSAPSDQGRGAFQTALFCSRRPAGDGDGQRSSAAPRMFAMVTQASQDSAVLSLTIG